MKHKKRKSLAANAKNSSKEDSTVQKDNASYTFDFSGDNGSDHRAKKQPRYAKDLCYGTDDGLKGRNGPPRHNFRRTVCGSGSWKKPFHPQTSCSRYYAGDDSTEIESKVSSMKPGSISENLRSALGLDETQLPLYIYRMRCLGYPPGHLEDACSQRSGIILFTKDRCEVTSDGKVLEEGEVDDDLDQDIYNINQLIDFPGFNVEPQPGTLDEHKRLNFPPMRPEQSKETMKKQLLERKNRRSSLESYNCSPTLAKTSGGLSLNRFSKVKQFSEEETNTWLSEMGLRATDGWHIVDVYCEDDNSAPDIAPIEESMSIDHCFRNSHSSGASTPPNAAQKPCSLRRKSSGHEQQNLSIADSNDSSRLSERYGDSIHVSSGTPIFRKDVLGSELPDASRFAVGLSEEILYENLPNSTGAFQRMRKVLSQIRSKTQAT